MIRLRRDRTRVPAALRPPKLQAKQVALLDPAHEFKSDWWKPGKDQLKRETGGKCAYCEAATAAVAHGDVEHFRPKSVYWWLAYCFDNHLYACQICNQSYKSDNFPVSAQRISEPTRPVGGTAAARKAFAAQLSPDPTGADPASLAALHAACLTEEPELIDPYLEDPEELLAWEFDDVLREVKVIARDDSDRARSAIRSAEAFFGLNREELRRLRYQTFSTARVFSAALPLLPPDAAATVSSELARMAAADAPFAGMVRYFARDVWKVLPP